jgi:hypothetical protein
MRCVDKMLLINTPLLDAVLNLPACGFGRESFSDYIRSNKNGASA